MESGVHALRSWKKMVDTEFSKKKRLQDYNRGVHIKAKTCPQFHFILIFQSRLILVRKNPKMQLEPGLGSSRNEVDHVVHHMEL